jgi:hypothetical protein
MAYQNFFARSSKPSRQTDAQISDNTVYSEFRMRNEGASAQVVECKGTFDDSAKTVTTTVVVKDPLTDEVVFERSFTCPK